MSAPSLPPRPFLGRIVYRSAAFWLLGRILVAAGLAWAAQPALELEPVTRLALVALVPLAVHLDLRRRDEDEILATLGVGWRGVALVCLPAPLAGELLLRVVAGV